MPNVEVLGLFTYPVKGMAATTHSRLEFDQLGAVGDRRYMVVDAEGRFLSQRNFAPLALFNCKYLEGDLTITYPQGTTIEVSAPVTSRLVPVSVHSAQFQATVVSAEADEWLSDRLKAPVRLVKLSPLAPRVITSGTSKEGDQVGFADGFPVLFAQQPSLDDLNRRLASPVPMNRFRANVVVSGDPAWAEFNWTAVQGATTSFDVARRCGRCLVTTIDQETAQRTGAEPLQTLVDLNNGHFGVYGIPRRLGSMAIGDQLTVIHGE